MTKVVAVLGASQSVDRYSYKAQLALVRNGFKVFPVNERYEEIAGLRCFPDIISCPEPIDTVTVYVQPSVLSGLVDDILLVKPRRVIFNPGTEDGAIQRTFESAGIDVQRACSLILLGSGQF